jgi:transketolase
VLNLHTIKPLDEAGILLSAHKTKCVVTAEEHNILGGMGDAVANVLARNFPVPQEYIGTNDTFGESGLPEQLMVKYGLTAQHIAAAAEKAISRKKA